MKALVLLLLCLAAFSHAERYTVFGVDGRNYGQIEVDKMDKEKIKSKMSSTSKHLLFMNKKGATANSAKQILPQSTVSQKSFVMSLDSKSEWLEVEKNEVVSICLPDSISDNWVVSNLPSRIQNDGCLQIQTPNLAGSSQIKFMADNLDYTYVVNLAIGMKYIDLSTQKHQIGYFGPEYSFKEPLYTLDALKDYYNRVFPDSLKDVSINEVLLVDKYLVTNCEIVQGLWDSIPSVLKIKASISKNYFEPWLNRKQNAVKNVYCDAHDSAAIKVYLYTALIYANARSVREGLTPVYSFEKLKDDARTIIPRVYEDHSFTVYTASFVGEYNQPYGAGNWLRVSVNKNANGYRLPYYNEWMALARAGSKNLKYVWGNSEDPAVASKHAWFGGGINVPTKGGDFNSRYYEQDSRLVGQLEPNAYGLYDMAGLVCENVMLPGKPIFAREVSSCKGGFLYSFLQDLNFGAHQDNISGGYGRYQGLRLVRSVK